MYDLYRLLHHIIIIIFLLIQQQFGIDFFDN